MATRIKWSSLLRLTELEFEPETPSTLEVSDEVVQAISILTGATRHDRRLLRCDENGALLISRAWNLFNSVQTEALYPESASEKVFTATTANKGVLLSSAAQLIKAGFVRVSGGDTEWVYIPADSYYWYPHTIYTVTIHVVPDPNGTASYIGVTAYN